MARECALDCIERVRAEDDVVGQVGFVVRERARHVVQRDCRMPVVGIHHTAVETVVKSFDSRTMVENEVRTSDAAASSTIEIIRVQMSSRVMALRGCAVVGMRAC